MFLSQNRLLNQFTADCTGRVVRAGPVEATAFGNCLMQAIALGHVGSLSEAREVVRNSVSPETFEPAQDRADGRGADEGFIALEVEDPAEAPTAPFYDAGGLRDPVGAGGAAGGGHDGPAALAPDRFDYPGVVGGHDHLAAIRFQGGAAAPFDDRDPTQELEDLGR